MADRSIRMILKAEVADFKRQVADAAREMDKIPASAARADTALGRMVQSARYNREAWERSGRALVAFGTVSVAALGASVKAAVDWESAWTGVLKTVDGTDSELAALQDDLRELARTLPATHEEIAAVAEAAGQLGVATPNVAAFTKTMIDLGETTNLSAQEAATGLARLANVMGTSQGDFDRLGSVIVELGNNFATTEREILDMAQRLASAGRVVGLTEAQTLALAAAMSSVGIEAEAGGSAVSRVMIRISQAVDKGGDDLAQFAEAAGMSATAFAERWRTEPVDALLAVVGGLADMTASGEGTFAMLDELGLRDIRVTNAMLSLSNAVGLTNRAVDEATREWQENNALLAEAEKRYATTASQVAIARNNLTDAAIEIGEHLLPVLAGLAEGVANVAQWFGALPDPIQGAIGGLGGLVGVTALVAGGFLLTFPRLVETHRALKDLAGISPRAAAGLRSVGVAGAALTAALVATEAFKALGAAIDEAVYGKAAQIDQLAISMTAFNATGEATGEMARIFGEDLSGLNMDLHVLDNGFLAAGDGVLGFIRKVSPLSNALPSTEFDQAQKDMAALDATLKSIIQAGDLETYGALMSMLTERAEFYGHSQEDLARLLPDSTVAYQDATNAVEDQAGAVAGLVDGIDALTGATGQVTEAQAEWRAEIAEIDAAFVSSLGAYDAVIAANTEYAQSVADATATSKDSWQDYYDGYSVNVDEYLAELQRQVDAQLAWETNMLLLSGRVSQGVLDELARMGPEGAPLVAELVDASDEQLARLEGLLGQRATGATDAFAANLEAAGPVVEGAAAQLGQGAADEIARKLAEGTATIEQIMWDYKLEIEGISPQIKLDTTMAYDEMQRFVEAYTNRTIPMNAVVYTGGQRQQARAGGGPVFGPGTETSDSIPTLLSTNEHVWSAAEVKGAGGHAAVAELRSLARAGGLRFADGGYVQPRYVMAPSPQITVTAPAGMGGFSGPLVNIETMYGGTPGAVGDEVRWAQSLVPLGGV